MMIRFLFWGLLSFVFLFSLNLFSISAKDTSSNLDLLAFSKSELWLTKQSAKIEELKDLVSSEIFQEWQRFLSTEKKNMIMRFDRITGKPSIIEGEGIPWIPGRVNNIKSEDLGLPPGIEGKDVPVLS